MSYRKIGDLIRLVDQRNKDLAITTLVGLTINKKFIPSVANTIGTDMRNYKIIRKNQFACSTMQVRRDKKMPVALLKDLDIAIISQAYPVFEVIDENTVLPDYLMLWFSRSEFDREACFHAVGGVRGSLEWEDFCTMELPIPSIEKQRELVAQYEAVANKIKVNEAICEKLEATAQALYKHWFVDFEFPVSDTEALVSDTEALEVSNMASSASATRGYKSSGGAMVFNEELEKEIPEGWMLKSLGEISTCLDFKRRPLSQEERSEKPGIYPYYGAMSIVGYIDEYIYDGDYLLFSEDGANIIDENGYPAIQYVWGKFWLNNHSHILEGKDFISIQFLYNALLKTNVSDLVTGAAQPKINQQNMNSISILVGKECVHEEFNSNTIHNYRLAKNYKEQNQKLTQLQSLLLSRLATLEG